MKISGHIASPESNAYSRYASRVTLLDMILNVLSFSHQYLGSWRHLGSLVERIKKRNPIFIESLSTYERRLFGSSSLQRLLGSWSTNDLFQAFIPVRFRYSPGTSFTLPTTGLNGHPEYSPMAPSMSGDVKVKAYNRNTFPSFLITQTIYHQ